MLKIRRSWDRLIFNMGIPYTGKTTTLYWDGSLLLSIGLVYMYLVRCRDLYQSDISGIMEYSRDQWRRRNVAISIHPSMVWFNPTRAGLAQKYWYDFVFYTIAVNWCDVIDTILVAILILNYRYRSYWRPGDAERQSITRCSWQERSHWPHWRCSCDVNYPHTDIWHTRIQCWWGYYAGFRSGCFIEASLWIITDHQILRR